MAEWSEILDASKIAHYPERIAAWERGERIAPITIDMALTRECQAACRFCFAQYQENDRKEITSEVMDRFLTDCSEIGVKGISLVSDGESTMSPAFEYSVLRGHELGIDMAVGTNGYRVTREVSERILHALTYIRINFTGGTKERYSAIMGVKPTMYDRICQNIRDMVAIKRERGLAVTIGMQFVLDPRDSDQVIPFAEVAKELGPDYAVIKHCSDTVEGQLGVDYSKYAELETLLAKAEAMSDENTKIVVKWNKLRGGDKRTYQRCYGPPFIVQISGSGLVAPCGTLFNDRYRKFHIGNIVDNGFKEIWMSDRWKEVMSYLSSTEFNAQKSCSALCLQHLSNAALDNHKKGIPLKRIDGDVQHLSFI